MKIHFISIGGAVMHNLAIALHRKGYTITGSDDEIYEPSRSRLKKHGLLPEKDGWSPDNITRDLDAVILGMHARTVNPELQKAQELGLRIYSFPEYLYEQTKNKIRVVIAGSHGKTTITAMVIHALKYHHWKFDYMLGSQLEGFETMVGLSDDSGIAVFEGDEYPASAIDKRPKFLLYHPHIALISGVAWDHMNVFPTPAIYLEQFNQFIEKIVEKGRLIYNAMDRDVSSLVEKITKPLEKIPYFTHPFYIKRSRCFLVHIEDEHPVRVFGIHNMQNINGARLVCSAIGLTDDQFYKAIRSFKGTARRLELIGHTKSSAIYLDFAHAPSKVKATVQAVKDLFPDRELVTALELHTYSSLNADYLPQYRGTMDVSDRPAVYYNPRTIEHKKLPKITNEQVMEAFGREGLNVFTDSSALVKMLKGIDWKNRNLLIMSSGNFDGVDFDSLAKQLLPK